jgi:hypothetical protein
MKYVKFTYRIGLNNEHSQMTLLIRSTKFEASYQEISKKFQTSHQVTYSYIDKTNFEL